MAPAPAAAAQVTTPAGFEMSRSVQQSLKRLQELWLQWLGASLQENPVRAGETLRTMQATARQIGFSRLPDLASGAVARALQSAAEGDFNRARREVDAAEALDPGRPDIAFAGARIARRQGAWGSALSGTLEGFRRLLSPAHRGPLMVRLALWSMLVAMVAAALFVLLQVASKGSALYADLLRGLAPFVPPPVAHLLIVLLLFGSLALPGGPVWLLLVWSALLWGYGSISERVAFVAVWLIFGTLPLGAAAIERRMVLAASPPIRALDRFEQSSLGGSLFSDLQVLRSALPDDPAVLELVADVHRTLGQWDISRTLYRQVLGKTDDATSPLINLGAHAFRKGDFASAAGYFQRAAATEPPSAAAWYDLSLAYSESYQFEESQSALSRAREIDSVRVDRWIQTPNPDRVLTLNGGLARRREIVSRLEEVWTASGAEDPGPGLFGRGQAPIAALLAAVLAVAVHLVRNRWGRYGEPGEWPGLRPGGIGRWARTLLPAISHAEAGEGGAAAANVVLLSVLLTLPALATLGGDFEQSAQARATALVISVAGLALYLFVVIRRQLAGGGS